MTAKISKPIIVLLAIGAFIALAGACEKPTWEDLLQPHITWVLESIDGSPVIEEVPVVLTINDDWIGGHDGCNSYWFSDEYDPPFAPMATEPNGSFMKGNFLGGHIGSTALFCDGFGGLAEQTDAYHEALREGNTFRIQDNQLEILDSEGQTTLVFLRQSPFPGNQPDLAGTQWTIVDGGAPFLLAFLDNKIAVGIEECVVFMEEYLTDGRLLRFSSMSRFTFREPCPGWWHSFNTLTEANLGSFWGAEHYAVNHEGGLEKLKVGNSLGKTFTFEPLSSIRFNWDHNLRSLANKTWVLWNIVDLSSDVPRSARSVSKRFRSEAVVTLTFGKDHVAGTMGCNSYKAFLSVSGESIFIGSPSRSDFMCDNLENVSSILKQELQYLYFLPRMTSMGTHGDKLFMSNKEGIYLLFEAE